VCNVPNGAGQGTCGPPPPPPPPPDGGVTGDGGSDGGVTRPDGGAGFCSQVGQGCGANQACCSGLVCTPPTGTGACGPSQTGCTCYGTIG